MEELLEFFPRDYETFSAPITIGEIGYKTFATVRGIFSQSLFQRKVKNLTITSAQFNDEIGGKIKVTWFNAPFMRDAVKPGQLYILRGRVSRKYGVLQLDQPKVYSPEDYMKLIHQMQPVYSLTKGITNALIVKSVKQALETECFNELDEKDLIPNSIREEMGLCKRSYAVSNLHFPQSEEAFQEAAVRMSFEEIFLFILAMKLNKVSVRHDSKVLIESHKETKDFINNLPFQLTNAQQKVIGEIEADLSSGKVMNRLIQGDVGSGKTIVALTALMNAAFSGYQSAFMAPTEVLASQHYETISKLLKENNIKLNAALLTGSMTALEKKVVYNALIDGKIDILIGTHAVFQEKVKYKNLGLVITDEQHRFGIKQREALALKGDEPHMIVMSATPIPRTLALIVYGDMDVSVIDEVPARRKPIKNAVVDESYRDNAYKFIEKEVRAGHQAYVICPMVEYSEGLDANNVTDYSEMLKDVLAEDITVGMLHGQMSPAKKNEIMQKFAVGEIDVLVSTTVVEVGVDVPNATVMMIEDANRFGLAQLHQLRGRVGRGDSQSYCIFVANNKSDTAMERLEVLKSSNNGFEIAEKDLSFRGPGEFMGIRQSGALSFKNFDLYRDADIAKKALKLVEEIIDGKREIREDEMDRLKDNCSVLKGGILL